MKIGEPIYKIKAYHSSKSIARESPDKFFGLRKDIFVCKGA
jgi:hypothetical protein